MIYLILKGLFLDKEIYKKKDTELYLTFYCVVENRVNPWEFI